MQSALPVEVLLGLYLGLLTGIVPALASGTLGFAVRYVTGVSLPGFGVVVLALSIASVNGGLLGLVEPDIAQSPRLLIAVVVVLMLSLYAHNQGDTLGQELPRHVSFSTLRRQTLSTDVVEFVGGMGRVQVRPTGEVDDLVGYPPLSADRREAIRSAEWEFPADLPLPELEARLEDRLRTEFDLAAVSVTLGADARAAIAAAPPLGELSRRIPHGHRAVSLSTTIPSGLAQGDTVDIVLSAETVRATVISVAPDRESVADDGPDAPAEVTPTRNGAPGGPGRVTITLSRRKAQPILEADSAKLVVRSRGTSAEFEAVAALHRVDVGIRTFTLTGTLERETVESILETGAVLAAREQDGVEDPSGRQSRRRFRRLRKQRAIGGEGEWVFGQALDWPIGSGGTLYAAGPEDELEALEAVVTP